MIGFLIKKGFFDFWDNMLIVGLMNIGYLIPLGLIYLAVALSAAEYSTILCTVILIIAMLVFSLYSLGVNAITFGFTHYKKRGFAAIKEALRFHWGHALLHFGICLLIGFTAVFIIPFYFAIGNYFGIILGMVIFWVIVALVLAIQYFFPLCFHMEADRPFKTLKKCFLVVADNFGTTMFLVLRTIFDLVLTILTATLLPGLSGIALSRMATMKLLMKKYDFLEENPDATKKDINWEDLLYEEKQLVGPRSIKNMIFPWKY